MPQAMATMPACQDTSPPIIIVQTEVGIVGWVGVMTGEKLTVKCRYCEKPCIAKPGEGALVEEPLLPLEAEPGSPIKVHQQGEAMKKNEDYHEGETRSSGKQCPAEQNQKD